MCEKEDVSLHSTSRSINQAILLFKRLCWCAPQLGLSLGQLSPLWLWTYILFDLFHWKWVLCLFITVTMTGVSTTMSLVIEGRAITDLYRCCNIPCMSAFSTNSVNRMWFSPFFRMQLVHFQPSGNVSIWACLLFWSVWFFLLAFVPISFSMSHPFPCFQEQHTNVTSWDPYQSTNSCIRGKSYYKLLPLARWW